MYRFIQNIGDYFNPGYFTEDFKKNVFTTSGYDNDAIKEFNKRFSGLRQKYFDYKQKVIEPALPMKYVLKHTHDFHTALLQALGYDTSEPYSQWLYLDDNRVVPVRHILKNGSQPQLLIMEMQPMIQRGDTKTEGLFEQQYSLPTDQDVEPARYRWKNWNLVDKNPIPEGCTISPKVINQAIEEIFYLPEDQRPRYVLMLAGNYVYMLEQKQFVRGSYLVFDLEELFAEVSISANRDYYALFYLLHCKSAREWNVIVVFCFLSLVDEALIVTIMYHGEQPPNRIMYEVSVLRGRFLHVGSLQITELVKRVSIHIDGVVHRQDTKFRACLGIKKEQQTIDYGYAVVFDILLKSIIGFVNVTLLYFMDIIYSLITQCFYGMDNAFLQILCNGEGILS